MDAHLLDRFIDEIKLQCRFARSAYLGIGQAVTQLSQGNEERDRLSKAIIDRHMQAQWSAQPGDRAQIEGAISQNESQQRLTHELTELYREFGHWPVFFYIYSFLVHAAIVSKVIWPEQHVSEKEKKAVGAEKKVTLEKLCAERGPAIREALGMNGEWQIQSRALRNDLEHYDSRMERWFLTSQGHNSMDLGLGPRPKIGGDAFGVMDFRRHFDPQTTAFFFEGGDYNLSSMMKELDDLSERASNWELQRAI